MQDNAVPRRGGAMHISTTRRHYVGADGAERTYEAHLLRRSVRVGKTVRHETLANLSHLPAELMEALRDVLSGKTLLVAGEGLELVRSLPHGHVAALSAQARLLGFPELLGPACKERDVAFGLVLTRGRCAQPPSWPRCRGGQTRRSWTNSVLKTSGPTRPIKQWTGCYPARARSRPSSPGGTFKRRPTLLVAPTSTCPLPGRRGRLARWRPLATFATANEASSGSTTRCWPTPRAARSLCGCSRERPRVPPRSSRR